MGLSSFSSLPAVLPRVAVSCVQSRMSSNHLKGHAERVCIGRKASSGTVAEPVPIARLSTAEDGGLNEGAGLHRLHAQEFGLAGMPSHHREVKGLTAAHAAHAGRTGERGAQACGRSGRFDGCEHREGFRLKRVAREHRGRFAVLHVHRGLAAAKRVVVHRGHVVVHKRIGVHELKRKRRAVKRLGARASKRRLRRGQKRARACRRQGPHSAWHRSAVWLAARLGQRAVRIPLEMSGRLGHPDLEVVLGSFRH